MLQLEAFSSSSLQAATCCAAQAEGNFSLELTFCFKAVTELRGLAMHAHCLASRRSARTAMYPRYCCVMLGVHACAELLVEHHPRLGEQRDQRDHHRHWVRGRLHPLCCGRAPAAGTPGVHSFSVPTRPLSLQHSCPGAEPGALRWLPGTVKELQGVVC